METNIYGDVLAVTCDDGTRHLIPLDAIASWDELLGCDTDMETVAAIIQVRLNRSDPGVIDPATGRTAWTSAYEQVERDELADRQQTRMAALHPVLTASGALSPDGREEARRLLGLDAMPVMEDADGRLAATLAGVADRIAVARDRFRRQSIDYLTDHRR